MGHAVRVTSGDLPARAPAKPRVRARTQIGISLAGGLLVAVPIAAVTSGFLFPIVAWDLTSAVYLVWVWLTIARCDAERTAELAMPEDPTRRSADLIVLAAAVASLVAVGVVLGRATNYHGAEQVALAGFGVLSIALSWAMVHTVYTLRYARLYYAHTDGGIDFNQDAPPTYLDFAYLAFTIGMTFQVSDTSLGTSELRATALRHALLSYLLGAGILASAVNLIGNLGG
jgi:uncharacterized membrane protein